MLVYTGKFHFSVFRPCKGQMYVAIEMIILHMVRENIRIIRAGFVTGFLLIFEFPRFLERLLKLRHKIGLGSGLFEYGR